MLNTAQAIYKKITNQDNITNTMNAFSGMNTAKSAQDGMQRLSGIVQMISAIAAMA